MAEHGLPYACITCGSDEHPHLVPKKLQKRSGIAALGCIFFFFGPVGWLLLLVLAVGVSLVGKGKTVSLPFCSQCLAGLRSLRNRAAGLMVLGFGSMFVAISEMTGPLTGWVASAGGLMALYALFEYTILKKQFQVTTLKVEGDRVLLDVPDDDYPGLYQRHLDTALLYGSSDCLGADIDEEF